VVKVADLKMMCDAAFYAAYPRLGHAPRFCRKEWGATGPYGFVAFGARTQATCSSTGSRLGDYATKYRLMGVAFHHKPTGDVLDDPNVSKSALYDIQPREIRILIPWNETSIADLVNGGDPMAAFGTELPKRAR
jgi:hypothetical protein